MAVRSGDDGTRTGDRRLTRRGALTIAALSPIALAACGGDGARFNPGQDGAAGSPSPQPPQNPIDLKITPAGNAKNLPASAEIGVKVTNGQITEVSLAEAGGGKVGGAMRPDGTAWVPGKPLKYGRTYTATVTASGEGGQSATRTTTFTVMKEPDSRADTGLYLSNGNTYGVAMPVVVEFASSVPQKSRASVQARMFVTSSPPQPGVWHWTEGGRQAYYRPPRYWQAGTKLTVRIALEGHPMGNGRYGDTDRTASVTIGRSLILDVENKTKQMSVYQDGKLIRKVPVSLGKDSTPSSSGTTVIMEKLEHTIFDTFAELGPVEGYRTPIDFAQRLTWGGEFIHSAPWSVGDQGVRNVSHGCVNVSPGNAVWLFNLTRIGDPVTVKGTSRKLAHGNGWTPWNLSWKDYIKGSAIPVPPELASGSPPAPKPSPSAGD